MLAVISIIYSMYQNRINQLKKLLDIRSKISRDLHDEIGSALTSIHILSKVSQSNINKDKTKSAEMMQKITDQSENMQQSISDIVWAMVEHTAHHRGALTVYSRPLGKVPPMPYGG